MKNGLSPRWVLLQVLTATPVTLLFRKDTPIDPGSWFDCHKNALFTESPSKTADRSTKKLRYTHTEHTEKPKNPPNTRKNDTTTTEDATEAVPVELGLV